MKSHRVPGPLHKVLQSGLLSSEQKSEMVSGLQISQARQSPGFCTQLYKNTAENLDDGEPGCKRKSLVCLVASKLMLSAGRNIFDRLPVGVIAGLWTVGVLRWHALVAMSTLLGQACTEGNPCVIPMSYITAVGWCRRKPHFAPHLSFWVEMFSF